MLTCVCLIFIRITNDENTDKNFTLKRIYKLNYVIVHVSKYSEEKKTHMHDIMNSDIIYTKSKTS